MKRPGVYILVNIMNGREYVGSSSNVTYRLKKHIEMMRHGVHKNKRIQREHDNGGEFRSYVHEFWGLTRKELYKKEPKFINTRQPELNISPFADPEKWKKWKKSSHEKKLKKKEKKKERKRRKKRRKKKMIR